MNASRRPLPEGNGPERWPWPIISDHYDTAAEVRPAEALAVNELGVQKLRRLRDHDPSAAGWRVIRRLLVPLEAGNAALDSPPTARRRGNNGSIAGTPPLRSLRASAAPCAPPPSGWAGG